MFRTKITTNVTTRYLRNSKEKKRDNNSNRKELEIGILQERK